MKMKEALETRQKRGSAVENEFSRLESEGGLVWTREGQQMGDVGTGPGREQPAGKLLAPVHRRVLGAESQRFTWKSAAAQSAARTPHRA